MGRPLVPELHDALKLTVYSHYDLLLKHHQDVLARLRPHFPATESWRGVVEHHCHPDIDLWPRSEQTFRLMVADGLAAEYSRLPGTRDRTQERSFVVHKLWAPGTVPNDCRLKSAEDVIGLLKFLAADPDWEEFHSRFGQILASRGEESLPAKNLCSLAVHSRLVGKFYRLLSGSPDYYGVPPELIKHPFERDDRRVMELQSQWKLKVVRARVRFPQRPIRTRDLGIFSAIEKRLDEFERVHPDNVFYRAGRELLLYYPAEAEPDLSRLCALGCWVQVEAATANVNTASDIGWLRKQFRPAPPVRARTLPDSFPPPICQLCQMAPASRHWPSDYAADADGESISEDLCEDCFGLRRETPPLDNLKSWSADSDARVAWMRLRLDFDALQDSLNELYRGHLVRLGLKADADAAVTLPVVTEFMVDYNQMVKELGRKLLEDLGHGNLETVAEDIWCCRCDSGQSVFRMLAVLHDRIRRFLPGLLTLDRSPISLAVVFCRARYPFFEVLDLLEAAGDGITVILPGKGDLRIPVKDLGKLLDVVRARPQFARAALMKLARIASLSEELARLTANASSGKEKEAYERFRPFGFKGLLTLARLLED